MKDNIVRTSLFIVKYHKNVNFKTLYTEYVLTFPTNMRVTQDEFRVMYNLVVATNN